MTPILDGAPFQLSAVALAVVLLAAGLIRSSRNAPGGES